MRSDRLVSEHPEFVGRSPIRWLLLALTVTAAMMPTPSLWVWGQYSMLLLAGLSLLLIEAIAFGRTRIYSPPVQWVWLILAGILAAHTLVDQYDAHLHWSGGSSLRGEVNNSAWFQLGLIWLGVMLFRQVNRKPDEVTIKLRSLLTLMGFLSHGVEVPAEHMQNKFVEKNPAVTKIENNDFFVPLNIHSSAEKPDNAFVAIEYQDYWFYIEHSDHNSKQAFGLLTYLYMLQAPQSPSGVPLITIPAG